MPFWNGSFGIAELPRYMESVP